MGRFFDPNDDEIREVYAEEAFIADVQYGIHLLMEQKGVTRAELARRIGRSAAYVTQMLSSKPQNLTARTIARIYAALGEEPCLQARSSLPSVAVTDATWADVAAAARDLWAAMEPEPEPAPAVERKGLPRESPWVQRYMKEAA